MKVRNKKMGLNLLYAIVITFLILEILSIVGIVVWIIDRIIEIWRNLK